MKAEEWKIPAIALSVMLLVVLFLSYWKTNQRLGEPGIKVVAVGENGELDIEFPELVLDYEGRVHPVSEGVINTLPADTTIGIRAYKAPDGYEMQVMGVLMGSDRTSIHQPEFCLTGNGYRITGSKLDTVTVRGPETYELPVMVIRCEAPLNGVIYPAFYVYWFVADGLATAQHWERMWLMAKGLFTTGELQRWAYVSCLGLATPDNEEAYLNRIKEFLGHAIPDFQPQPKLLVGGSEAIGRAGSK
ncbi:MAG: hypothetical protein M2R45_02115 [Verrucomicrobia subdivision 3 bacterium]|nr:hypothetical protein [Limisphaerales bacterium]MCS1413826.1 hypothetical protein [Limisphaerales bacterium]